MKEIFEIYFETSHHDPEYTTMNLKYATTEHEVNNKILPYFEEQFGINSDYGKIYDRKLSYSKLSFVKEWNSDRSLKIELNKM